MNGLRLLPFLLAMLLCQCAGGKVTPVTSAGGPYDEEGVSFKSGGNDDNQIQMTGVMGAAVSFGNQPRFDPKRNQ